MRVLIDNINGDPVRHLDGCDTSGQNLFVHHLARGLQRLGVSVSISTRATSPEDEQPATDWEGVEIWRIRAGPKRYMYRDEVLDYLPRYIKELTSVLRKHGRQLDLVHGNYWLSGPVLLNLKAQHIARAIAYTPHSLGRVKFGLIGGGNRRRDELESEILNAADLVHVLSEDEKAAIEELYPPTTGTVVQVGHGVAPEAFYFVDKEVARKQLGWRTDQLVVLFVGRFEDQKNFPMALRAFRKIEENARRHGGSVRFVVCGGTSKHTPAFLDAVSPLFGGALPYDFGVTDVSFLGRIKNDALHMYYCAADALIMPSRYEPFGLVAVEALGCGLPVVASNVGGLRGSVRNGIDGYLVEPQDEAGFIEALRQLLEPQWQRPAIRKRIAADAHGRFSWDDSAKALARAYLGVVNKVHAYE